MFKNTLYGLLCILLLVSCDSSDNYPGVEYAPQMYHSVPYEPLTQFTDEEVADGFLEQFYYIDVAKSSNSIDTKYTGKKHIINSLEPVSGTVKRQKFASVEADSTGEKPLLVYNIAPDDYETAEKELQNPLPKTDQILEEGQHLYEAYCQHCHGAEGKGDGKVGKVYKGVANLQGAAYKNKGPGHIFHVITHGKGRMWAHKSQLNPEERWKVVHYVKTQIQGAE